jgi:hypothetical protein
VRRALPWVRRESPGASPMRYTTAGSAGGAGATAASSPGAAHTTTAAERTDSTAAGVDSACTTSFIELESLHERAQRSTEEPCQARKEARASPHAQVPSIVKQVEIRPQLGIYSADLFGIDPTKSSFPPYMDFRSKESAPRAIGCITCGDRSTFATGYEKTQPRNPPERGS